MAKKAKGRTRARAPGARQLPLRPEYRAAFAGHGVETFYASNDANAKRIARMMATSLGRLTDLYATGKAEPARNPKRRPARRGTLRTAVAAFEEFTGHQATVVQDFALPDDAAGWLLGPVTQINYIATRDGETVEYEHRFAANRRPQLIASSDGDQLYILSGEYRVTDKGIEG